MSKCPCPKYGRLPIFLLIFTIGFSNRAALYSWSVTGIPALFLQLGMKNVRFQIEGKWVGNGHGWITRNKKDKANPPDWK